MTKTEAAQAIADEYGIDFSVAMDIHYLRNLEKRIVAASKANPSLWDFPVYNNPLEETLYFIGV